MTFREVLMGFEADLSPYRLEEHALSKHAVELHRRTGGYCKALTYVVSTAAVITIRQREHHPQRDRRRNSPPRQLKQMKGPAVRVLSILGPAR